MTLGDPFAPNWYYFRLYEATGPRRYFQGIPYHNPPTYIVNYADGCLANVSRVAGRFFGQESRAPGLNVCCWPLIILETKGHRPSRVRHKLEWSTTGACGYILGYNFFSFLFHNKVFFPCRIENYCHISSLFFVRSTFFFDIIIYVRVEFVRHWNSSMLKLNLI